MGKSLHGLLLFACCLMVPAIVTTPVLTTTAESSETVTLTAESMRDKIRSMLALRHNRYTLRRYLSKLHFADLAEIMNHYLTKEETLQCFLCLGPTQAAEVLPGLHEELQPLCLQALPKAKRGRLIRLMPVDEAVDLLQLLSQEERRSILGELPPDADTQALHRLLIEEPDTAAGIMSTEFIRVPVTASVGEALESLRQAQQKTFIYYVFLVDKEERLIGVVSLKQMLLGEETAPLTELAHFDVKSVLDSFDQELVIKVFRKYYNLLAVPVVDSAERLLGIITLDDIIDLIDEESQEDLYRVGGVHLGEEVDEKNLLTGPVVNAVKARLPWLSITLVGQLVIASIIAAFEPTVSRAVIAFSFLPLLCGLAGNVGTQSDTITVRGLALELVRGDNIKQTVRRELRVAGTVAGIFALIVGIVSFLLYKHLLLSGLLMSFIFLSACVSASMGMLVPYVVRSRLKMDPAGIGGPFITTSMDLLLYTLFLSVLTMLAPYLI